MHTCLRFLGLDFLLMEQNAIEIEAKSTKCDGVSGAGLVVESPGRRHCPKNNDSKMLKNSLGQRLKHLNELLIDNHNEYFSFIFAS